MGQFPLCLLQRTPGTKAAPAAPAGHGLGWPRSAGQGNGMRHESSIVPGAAASREDVSLPARGWGRLGPGGRIIKPPALAPRLGSTGSIADGAGMLPGSQEGGCSGYETVQQRGHLPTSAGPVSSSTLRVQHRPTHTFACILC